MIMNELAKYLNDLLSPLASTVRYEDSFTFVNEGNEVRSLNKFIISRN